MTRSSDKILRTRPKTRGCRKNCLWGLTVITLRDFPFLCTYSSYVLCPMSIDAYNLYQKLHASLPSTTTCLNHRHTCSSRCAAEHTLSFTILLFSTKDYNNNNTILCTCTHTCRVLAKENARHTLQNTNIVILLRVL